jgi:hypothetical protein
MEKSELQSSQTPTQVSPKPNSWKQILNLIWLISRNTETKRKKLLVIIIVVVIHNYNNYLNVDKKNFFFRATKNKENNAKEFQI